jgi:tetratricopeptide (TPR) repeat protein
VVLESVYVARRVAIGYDDSRRVMILHDPSLGPACEVGYDDFERMWGAAGKRYTRPRPSDWTKRLAGRSVSSRYRQRTPDEQAAQHFLYGYAHSAIGQPDPAEEHFRKGLAIAGISKAYRHLLLIELASLYHFRGKAREAAQMAEEAIQLLPDNGLAYRVLAHVYEDTGDRKAGETRKKAEQLVRSDKARREVARALPRDFWIPWVAEMRGWGTQEER